MTKELVTLEEVKAAEGMKSNKALRELIAEMELYQQKLVDSSKFKVAKAVVECVKCEKVLDSRDDLGREMCRYCLSVEKRELEEKKRVEEYNANLIFLAVELEELGGTYKIVEDRFNRSYPYISNGKNCTISRSYYYSGGRYPSNLPATSHPCFQITTSDSGIRADLRSYFGSPGLAKRLHKKCVELEKKIEAKENRKKEKEDTLTKAKNLALATFPELKPDGIEVRYPTPSPWMTPKQRGVSARGPESIRFKVGRLHLGIYMGSDNIYVVGIGSTSVEEIKKIQEVLSS